MRLDRSAYELEFDETFAGPQLDEARWLDHYLPHWSTPDLTRARYRVDGQLHLLIEEGQSPWAPELDGGVTVSNVQTGTRSGPVGSQDGQHRFVKGATVRTWVAPLDLYTPSAGLVEARARAVADPNCMVALWLIGTEQTPEESGELCVFEIFGSEVTATDALVGVGIHPHHDARIRDDFTKVRLQGDATDFHTYSMTWGSGAAQFFIDDELVHEIDQATDYPLQLMLDIYQFEPGGDYPKDFTVDWVRGYRRLNE